MVFSFNKESFQVLEPFYAGTSAPPAPPPLAPSLTTPSSSEPQITSLAPSLPPQQTASYTTAPSITTQLVLPTPTTQLVLPTPTNPKTPTPYQSKDIFDDLFRNISKFIKSSNLRFYTFIVIITLFGLFLLMRIIFPLLRRVVRKRNQSYGSVVSY